MLLGAGCKLAGRPAEAVGGRRSAQATSSPPASRSAGSRWSRVATGVFGAERLRRFGPSPATAAEAGILPGAAPQSDPEFCCSSYKASGKGVRLRFCQPGRHQAHHGGVDKSLTTCGQVFVIFATPPRAVDPSEGALDNPAFRQHIEGGVALERRELLGRPVLQAALRRSCRRRGAALRPSSRASPQPTEPTRPCSRHRRTGGSSGQTGPLGRGATPSCRHGH